MGHVSKMSRVLPNNYLLIAGPSSSHPSRLCVCAGSSSPDLHMLFLAVVGPVGWGLSLSYMTREQINTKHTLG